MDRSNRRRELVTSGSICQTTRITGPRRQACLAVAVAAIRNAKRRADYLTLPVDPLLLENARQLVKIWRSWYPELKLPEIHAPTRRAAVTAGRVAQFFSAASTRRSPCFGIRNRRRAFRKSAKWTTY